jgi:hypothetical protein
MAGVDVSINVDLLTIRGMSLAVLKFARQALLVDDAMRRPPAVQGRG